MAVCKICRVTDEERQRRGQQTLGPDELCDGCWEVTHRLDDFLRYKYGRVYVLEALKKHEENRT